LWLRKPTQGYASLRKELSFLSRPKRTNRVEIHEPRQKTGLNSIPLRVFRMPCNLLRSFWLRAVLGKQPMQAGKTLVVSGDSPEWVLSV
jgi:hypothetical protein